MWSLMVTIRCTVYNHEPYIRQCLEGFVMQKTNFKFEAIVHDDASTDGTATIIREYAAKYPDIIKPIYETENQYSKGDGSLTRIMDAHTHGKYVAYCEGDDYWTDPLKLQKQIDFLESHSDYSMCFHQASICNELDQSPFLDCFSIGNREYLADELFLKWIVPTASIVYRNDITPIEQFVKPSRILNGDIILVLNCALHGKIRGVSETMSVYRMHSTGVTYDKNVQRSRILKYPDHYKFIKENFPMVNKTHVNIRIADSYCQILKMTSILDILWIKSFCSMVYYDPWVVVRKSFRFFRKTKKQK